MNKILEDPIRKLARSRYWQILYGRAKELNGIRLFENIKDLSKVQIVFLQLLEMYAGLYLDLALNEDLISEEVIEDSIRADSYLLYKRKERENRKTDKKIKDKPFQDRIMFRPRKNKQKGKNN